MEKKETFMSRDKHIIESWQYYIYIAHLLLLFLFYKRQITRFLILKSKSENIIGNNYIFKSLIWKGSFRQLG